MAKVELLTTKEISEETKLKVSVVLAEIKKGALKAKKINRTYMVTREDLNAFLGLETTSETLKKDIEIRRLKDQIEGYKRQYETIKQLMGTLEGVINSF